MQMYPSDFESAPLPIRITLLAALCQVRQAELTEGLVELLVQLVHKISVRAEKKVEGEINAEFRRVHGKNGILVKLATAGCLARAGGRAARRRPAGLAHRPALGPGGRPAGRRPVR